MPFDSSFLERAIQSWRRRGSVLMVALGNLESLLNRVS